MIETSVCKLRREFDMTITLEDYKKKVLGCWMGKNIGGTLGAPFEWRRQVNNVDFYTQDLKGEPLPNDDLDIQLLWLIMLEEQGINVNAHIMAEYWQNFVTPYWAEYGNAKVNMQAGILPPYTGIRNNYYKNSCGAFIRSEIWACIAPGRPDIAAKYAYEDAILDHGDGEGTHAAVFCAAMESAAFIEKDINKLIEIGLSYIPEDCGIVKAIHCAIASYKEGLTWLEARHKMLEAYRGSVFFGSLDMIAKEDIDRGFAEGDMGWDAPSNIGILIIGLLYGEGDFDRSLCTTVNCGEDTDCTGATLGALYGIIYGIDHIPEKWIQPIGRGIKTACLNIGDLGFLGSNVPADVDNLTARTESIMRKIAFEQGLPVEMSGITPKSTEANDLYASKAAIAHMAAVATRHSFPFYDIALEYVTGVSVKPGESAKLRLHIKNKYRFQASLNICCYVPDGWGWEVLPGKNFKSYIGQAAWYNNDTSIDLEFKSNENYSCAQSRFVIEITVDGRTTVMLVPVLLLIEVLQ